MAPLVYSRRTLDSPNQAEQKDNIGVTEGWSLVEEAQVYGSSHDFVKAVLRASRDTVILVFLEVLDKRDLDVVRFTSMLLGADANIIGLFGPDLGSCALAELTVTDEPLAFTASEMSLDVHDDEHSTPKWSFQVSPSVQMAIELKLAAAKAWREDPAKRRFELAAAGKWPPIPKPPLDWIFKDESMLLIDLVRESRVEELTTAVEVFPGFDPHKYSEDELVVLVYIMVKSLLDPAAKEDPSVFISEGALLWLIMVVRACYPSNAYHNFRHATDVVQGVYFQLKDTKNHDDHPISPLDRFSTLLAALGHDIFHPGVAANTLKRIECPWGKTNESLEAYHYQVFTELLQQLWPRTVDDDIRSVVEPVIAATEMAKHELYLKEVNGHLRSGQLLWLSQVVKVADISNCAREFEISISHSLDLAFELVSEVKFKEVAKLENPNPFNIPLITDRNQWEVLAPLQISFIDVYVRPLFEQAAHATHANRILMDSLVDTVEKWDAVRQKQENPVFDLLTPLGAEI